MRHAAVQHFSFLQCPFASNLLIYCIFHHYRLKVYKQLIKSKQTAENVNKQLNKVNKQLNRKQTAEYNKFPSNRLVNKISNRWRNII